MATGEFSVIINNYLAKWCTNACTPYVDQSEDIISINSNGIIWCSNKQEFTCIGKKCHCKKLQDILFTNAKILIDHTNDTVLLSSCISLKNLETITTIGHNKLTVLFINGSGISLSDCNSSVVKGIKWVGCGDTFNPVLNIYNSFNVTIDNCSFQNSMGIAIKVTNVMGNVNISNCNLC